MTVWEMHLYISADLVDETSKAQKANALVFKPERLTGSQSESIAALSSSKRSTNCNSNEKLRSVVVPGA